MGGSANGDASDGRRRPPEEYEAIKNKVLKIVTPLYDRVGVPRYIGDKKDFGDLDVVVKGVRDPQHIEIITRELKSKKVNSNGYTHTSFEFEGFQVDIINVGPKYYDMYYAYSEFSDMVGLLGMAVNYFGLKLGQQGLYLRLESKDVGEENNTLLKPYELVLTNDPLKAFEYVGCNVQQYLRGFETQLEMVEFLCRTKFFRPHIFRPSAATYGSRKRMTRRPFCVFFRDYLALHYPEQMEDDYKPPPELKPNLKAIRDQAIKDFGKERERKQWDIRARRTLALRNKLPGQLLMEVSGFQGLELGAFKRAFIEQWESKDAHQDFLLGATDEEILTRLKIFAEGYRTG